MTWPTLVRTPCRLQIPLCIFKLDTISYTHSVLCATSSLFSSTGSWWEKSNKEFTESMRNTDGEDQCISKWFILFQELLPLLTLSALTASSKKTTGDSLPTWPFSTVFSCGLTSLALELNNIPSLISEPEKPSKTYSGLTLPRCACILFSASSMKELSQSMTLAVFILITNSTSAIKCEEDADII